MRAILTVVSCVSAQSRYWMSTERVMMGKAMMKCESKSRSLIDSFYGVRELVDIIGNSHVWVGITDLRIAGKYRTTEGK